MSFRKPTILSTVVAIVAVAAILIVTVVNVQGLTGAVQRRTDNYLRDVSEQSAQVINERFAGRTSSLDLVGESMSTGTVRDEGEFLQRKLDASEFEALAYVRPDGYTVVATKNGTQQLGELPKKYMDTQSLMSTFEGVPTAGFYDNYVAFMEPIKLPKEQAEEYHGEYSAMIGVRTKESLQELLVNDAFDGSGFTFIIDQYDEILAEPMNEEDYEALSSLLHSLVTDTDLRTVLTQLDNPDDDSLEYTLEVPGGTTLLLDYQLLEMFDWAVVTAVDESFLAEVIDEYVQRIVITLIVFIAIFVVLLFLLIWQQRRYQKRVEVVAFVDSLTGGMSFIRFRMLAEPMIEKSEEGAYALATLNVKRFKLINRIGGSREGDDVLRRIYDVIRRNLNEPDEMVAHSTADNFVLLLRNEGEEALTKRLKRIAKEAESLQTVMPVRISEGVYVADADSNVDLIMFLDRSNMARVSAKQEYNSTCVFYDDDFVEKQEERLRMLGMIEEGLEKKEFTVYLQPKVSPVTSRLVGSEALVRWKHPQRGMIGPNIFIPLCEQNGLICQLDLYVFDRVCEDIRRWLDNGWTPSPISVNVSGLHLKEPDFVKQYREIADKHRVDPSIIELELTESIMFSDLEMLEARSVIDTIHEYGFKCSMDDFGSGYSALGVLADLPIDCIKLDRSFFIDCIGNPRAQTVIATIIRLAQDLHITSVAEGIETIEQVEMLKRMGVDMIQGFYYSRPLPIQEFDQFVFVDNTTFPVKKPDSAK